MPVRRLDPLLLSAALCAVFAPAVVAHGSNGMDMSMDGAMDLAAGNMRMWFHFTPGDLLWFYGWVPTSVSAMVGTCIGLFLLALVDRWIAACRGVMEAHWSKRAAIEAANRANLPSASAADKQAASMPGRFRDTLSIRKGPPFIASNDIARGVIHAVQSALHFAIMLAVMTFQLAFIISIVIGMGVGEALFGRFGSSGHHG